MQTETVCDCGYSFTEGADRKPRPADGARTSTLWTRIAGWALGFAPLGGFIGLFGGAGVTCTFLFPGTHETDARGHTR